MCLKNCSLPSATWLVKAHTIPNASLEERGGAAGTYCWKQREKGSLSYGWDINDGRGSSRWSSTLLHHFCSPVTVLLLNIWRLTSGGSRMANRVCGCDVSKIGTIGAVKPFLGGRLDTPHWHKGKKPQTGESCIPDCWHGYRTGDAETADGVIWHD